MIVETLASAPPASADFLPIILQLDPVVHMTQDQFFDFCQLNPEMRFERTAKGGLVIMPPAGTEAGIQNLWVAGQLLAWRIKVGKGEATDSSGGFTLPNGANCAPDAAWISPEQLATISREQLKKFAPICPYFVTEVMSPSDSLKKMQEKMEEYMANGSRLGWLIVPNKRQVHVYRPGQ